MFVSLMEFIFTGFNSTGKSLSPIYIYEDDDSDDEFKASFEASVAKGDNPYYPYDQTLVGHDSIATPDLVEDWFPASAL